jgi:hypothetical protein
MQSHRLCFRVEAHTSGSFAALLSTGKAAIGRHADGPAQHQGFGHKSHASPGWAARYPRETSASIGQCTTPDVAHRLIPPRALSSEGRVPKRDQRARWRPCGARRSARRVSRRGVQKPRVWRGWPLSLRATSSSSARVTPARLLPLGKYWRSRPWRPVVDDQGIVYVRSRILGLGEYMRRVGRDSIGSGLEADAA